MEEEIDGNRYFVKGTPQEVAAHEKIVGLQIRAATTRLAVPYAASVAFAVIAALLIAFAPESRSVAGVRRRSCASSSCRRDCRVHAIFR